MTSDSAHRPSSFTARVVALAFAVLFVGACSDAPSAPPIAPRRPNLDYGTTAPNGDGSRLLPPSPYGTPIPDEYLVVFKESVSESDVESLASQLASSQGATPELTYTDAFKGFLVHVSPTAAAAISNDPRVDFVEQDQEATTDQGVGAQAVQVLGDSAWGIDRIDQAQLPVDHRYNYTGTAADVTVYVIDTGIQTAHPDFGGRAAVSFDAYGGNGQDCNGHGTHVAGTVGGAKWGVAKAVQLRAVRVLPCAGPGAYSRILAGINWVRRNHATRAVANMSLGGGYSPAVNKATTALVNAGVFVAVASGNSRANACFYSPASAPGAVSVAATGRDDFRALFSNWGPCVHLYAPGEDISSDWPFNITKRISGTSMASPHVAGVAALYKSANPGASPAAIKTWILNNATAGVVKGNVGGTPNLLLFKGNL